VPIIHTKSQLMIHVALVVAFNIGEHGCGGEVAIYIARIRRRTSFG
jgi:hypothetical protein